MGSQRVGHDCATELNWTTLKVSDIFVDSSIFARDLLVRRVCIRKPIACRRILLKWRKQHWAVWVGISASMLKVKTEIVLRELIRAGVWRGFWAAGNMLFHGCMLVIWECSLSKNSLSYIHLKTFCCSLWDRKRIHPVCAAWTFTNGRQPVMRN